MSRVLVSCVTVYLIVCVLCDKTSKPNGIPLTEKQGPSSFPVGLHLKLNIPHCLCSKISNSDMSRF